MGTKLELKVVNAPAAALALTNQVFLNEQDAVALTATNSVAKEKCYLQAKGFVFTFRPNEKIPPGCIGLNTFQRQTLYVSLNEKVPCVTFLPNDNMFLGMLKLQIDFYKEKKINEKFSVDDLKTHLVSQFEQQIFNVDQKFVVEFRGLTLIYQVMQVECVNLQQIASASSDGAENANDSVAADTTPPFRGILLSKTQIAIERAPGSQIALIGSAGSSMQPSLFRPDWKFESMGIGGLDKEFGDIFRRAFASRIFPSSVVQKLGIQHVKGILLFGPPGTGKTLMARQIGKMLNGKEPKVVNGPEILNKYVGQSEENIRNLFKDAETEYKTRGEDSELHIIIFDELDAICRARGSRNDGTGVGDTVVNQLLAKIDGVESLNNILIIGMTNRKELIDEALLRPGRMEVHMEIGLPDVTGRVQIFRIHTAKMRNSKYMDEDISLEELAELTKNYSGAEIEGVVKAATSFAFTRQIDSKNLTKPLDPEKIKICRSDFGQALSEVKPAFGMATDEFENCVRNGIINYGQGMDRFMRASQLFIQQVRRSERTPLVSILLDGLYGSGKTALAATIAKLTEFPFVRLLSAETLVGYSEAGKCAKITKIFEDSYRSQLSAIVVDDIERILEYVPIGPRFSNTILQTLLVLFKKMPPKGRKLMVVATTSSKDVLEQMGFMDCFNAVLSVPNISTHDEFRTVLKELQVVPESELELAARSFTSERITIKKMLMITELARQGDQEGTVDRFVNLMTEYSSA